MRRRQQKTELDLLVLQYARMKSLDRALARAAINGAELVLSLHDDTATVSPVVENAFAELGGRIAQGDAA